MVEQGVKAYLHDELRRMRSVIALKVDGLSEYHARRPLTSTGTNLLGLIKHVAIGEAFYFGEALGRPFTHRWLDEAMKAGPLAGMWLTPDESRLLVLDRYQQAIAHADESIQTLDLDAPAHVPWWPRPDASLFAVLVHMLTETTRHVGHADILREHVDGTLGNDTKTSAHHAKVVDLWAQHRARVEIAAKAAH